MLKEEKFYKKNTDLQQKIRLEIERVKEGQSQKSIIHLQTILKELQECERTKKMVLSFPSITFAN